MDANAVEKLFEAATGTGLVTAAVKVVGQIAVAAWNTYKQQAGAAHPDHPTNQDAAIQAIVAATEREAQERRAREEAERQLAELKQLRIRHEIAEMIRDSAPFENKEDLAELIEKGEIEDEQGHKVVLKATEREQS